MLGFFPDIILFWAAVIGLILAVFGERRWPFYLVTPALLRWLIWPAVTPIFLTAFATTPWWEKALAVPLIALFVVFAGIKFLQGAVEGVYGAHVSVRVTSHALIATLRAIGRVLGVVFLWPIRAFKKRQTMDETLRRWRRH